ncbi:DUF6807 family protein [Posidoniimonas corsicana]|uniref:DUF6807 family protein n=1 Tax=Posidoniimonas corsicana TaxID=1938618 RepID=UPI0018D31F15|nr:DUF6807 family protein [Posidoniimonas corsicana]
MFRSLLVVAALAGSHGVCGAGEQVELAVAESPGRVALTAGGEPVITYVYQDEQISRPYFCDLFGPGGVRVSRNHPPIAGQDKADHPEYHPGLWLAFGELSGADNWRLKAPVQHARMLQPPTVDGGVASLAVENRYANPAGGEPLCSERCRYELHATPWGYLLTWDSTFYGDRPFSFGDQEEMGLGIRMATPLRVESGGGLPDGTGRILDAKGRVNAAEVWGQTADWVDYSGVQDGQPAGVTLFCPPSNFRPTYFHARDYGYICANAFSTAAFKLGPASRTEVKPGESLRLRYGVLLYAGAELTSDKINDAYQHYLELLAATTTQ